MKYSKPHSLAFNSSLIITAIFASSYSVISLIYKHFDWMLLVIVSALLIIIAYFIIHFVLEKFIYEKIKPIYKTIYTEKATPGEKERQKIIDENTIDNANEIVLKWAEDRKLEISELKKLEKYRREFIGNVSHELKTPIFNIQGYIVTLLEGGLHDESVNVEFLKRAESNISRMITIVEDLEAISHLETGELELQPERFDIIALTRQVMDLLERKAQDRNNRLHFADSGYGSIYVIADKERIRQVLVNLFDNAIKYGREDNAKTKISFFDMHEQVLVEVSDNGIGIAKEEIGRLFERFYRTDRGRSRAQGGSGLGLSIVKHIIEAHQQTINVRSSPGIGTTFGFTVEKG